MDALGFRDLAATPSQLGHEAGVGSLLGQEERRGGRAWAGWESDRARPTWLQCVGSCEEPRKWARAGGE